ncbi:tol-pal system protein YbgF [Pseudogemmobacter faecipullorum]|uniref:Cell division coordinator CpoB n=1 Tax=Pseudogemmobacter faecipullorum TaxID=2755041 RepID=A0ABS8CGG7_9RHOB|nr:tol-pal system protein YbgF [Pseudogemmobacter faecipullorum]MCB5408475.1 tol-pal system protein YbgF [Pseudogemmobacter faecipullorum]
MRARFLLPVLALGFAMPASAESLADVRVELGQLAAEFNRLKAELTTTGASARVGGADALARMDTLESELMRLTSRTEEIELKLNRVVSDGTNRIGDIEFRLCEAEPGCDPMNMPPTGTLGGGSGGGSASAAPVITPSAPASNSSAGPELAVAEKEDFDRAKGVLGQGDFPGAASLFEAYAQSYPGGPLVPEAHFLRGEALGKAGEKTRSARAYLDAYTSDPKGPFAPEAVLRLGQSLGDLGQTDQACVTLAQIGIEYPGSNAASQAPMAMQALGCR